MFIPKTQSLVLEDPMQADFPKQATEAVTSVTAEETPVTEAAAIELATSSWDLTPDIFGVCATYQAGIPLEEAERVPAYWSIKEDDTTDRLAEGDIVCTNTVTGRVFRGARKDFSAFMRS